MPVIQSKQCGDDKPGKDEVEYLPRIWYFHKPCPDCDVKRSAPCQNCSSK